MASCSKTYDLTNPKDVEEVQRMMVEDDEGDLQDDFDDEEDTDGEYEVEPRKGDSETEQEASDDDDYDTNGSNTDDNKLFFGREKSKGRKPLEKTKWNKNPPSQRVRSKSHNLIRKLPGVIGAARMAKTPFECWSCIMDDEIMGIIVQQTNQYIESIKSLFKRDRDAKPIDIIELKAFIGLLYLAGVHRGNRQSLEDLWGSDGDGIEKFRLVMNIKRFKFIMRCMRFDDRTTRNERRKTDKLAAIRDIFTMLVKNSQKSYSLGENVTIDEKLEGFRGRCGFVQYIPSKPNKYGVKIYALVDSKVYYVYNLEIYAGLQPEGPFRLSNSPSDVVLRLCQPIYQTGRNVTADNWFTSIPLIDELRRKNLSYVGTLKKNKVEIPPEFLPNNTRAVNSSLFAFKKGCTLVSYVPRKGKCVILASSLHEDNSIDLDTGDKKKPCIITFYNGTKGGVDTTDKMCASFNVARNIRRWPMVVFFAMLNISGINAQVIYFGNDKKVIRRKTFLKKLSHELVLPHMARRSLETSGIHTGLQQRLKGNTPVDKEQQKEESENVRKRKRCHSCTGQKRLTKYNCKKCKNPICLMHIVSFCNDCSQILSNIPQDDIDEGMA